jgi:hypothetical protein
MISALGAPAMDVNVPLVLRWMVSVMAAARPASPNWQKDQRSSAPRL